MRDEFVAATRKSIDALPEKNKLKGIAAFASPNILVVGDQRINAKAVVIATGSKPVIPPEFDGLSNILTNETVFELDDLPPSLAVIGAGPLGLELAQAFARLGVHVEVFDEGDSIAALKDEAVAKSLRIALEQEFPLHLGAKVKARAAGGGTEIAWSDSTKDCKIFTHVLIAAGRPPELSGLNLAQARIELDRHATPLFDRNTMQCGSSSIFLAGDCDADVPVLHEASAEGAIAGYNAAHFPHVRPSRRATRFAITFTDPPSASIGRDADSHAIIGETDFSDQGRAKLESRNVGLVRLYADREGTLTGATMAAPESEHLAHLIVWAIEHRQTVMQLLDLPIYHPTYEEGLRTALRQICEQIDVETSSDRDGGPAPGI
jgi:dihydrolipoamide dehydrogenase